MMYIVEKATRNGYSLQKKNKEYILGQLDPSRACNFVRSSSLLTYMNVEFPCKKHRVAYYSNDHDGSCTYTRTLHLRH